MDGMAFCFVCASPARACAPAHPPNGRPVETPRRDPPAPTGSPTTMQNTPRASLPSALPSERFPCVPLGGPSPRSVWRCWGGDSILRLQSAAAGPLELGAGRRGSRPQVENVGREHLHDKGWAKHEHRGALAEVSNNPPTRNHNKQTRARSTRSRPAKPALAGRAETCLPGCQGLVPFAVAAYDTFRWQVARQRCVGRGVE